MAKLHPAERERRGSKGADAKSAADAVESALAMIQRTDTRAGGLEAMQKAAGDAESLANALWRISGESQRKFSHTVKLLKNIAKEMESDELYKRADAAEALVLKTRRIQRILCERSCSDPDTVRQRVYDSILARKPLDLVVVVEPPLKGEPAQQSEQLISLMKMLHQLDYAFNAKFVFDDVGPRAAVQPELSRQAYRVLSRFIMRKHNPSLSFPVKASDVLSRHQMPQEGAAAQGGRPPGAAPNVRYKAIKGIGEKHTDSVVMRRDLFRKLRAEHQGAVFITNAPPELAFAEAGLPMLTLHGRSLPRNKLAGDLRVALALAQVKETRESGMNALLNIAMTNPGAFPEILRMVSPQRKARSAYIDMVGIQMRTARPDSREWLIAQELSNCLKDAETEIQTSEAYAALVRREYRNAFPLQARELRRRVKASVAKGSPTRLKVLVGGYKESRSGRADQFDLIALQRLKKWADSISHPAELSIIFCDVHATVLNGKRKGATDRYYESLVEMISANKLGIEVVRLSELYEKWRKDPLLAQQLAQAEASAVELVKSANLRPFESMARKHSDLVRTGKRKTLSVVANYLRIRGVDDAMLELEYPGSISVSVGGNPARESAFAKGKRPTVFFSAIRGVSDPWWFLDAGAGPDSPSTIFAHSGPGGPVIEAVLDRALMNAEKLLRRVSLDVSADQEMFHRTGSIRRMREACSLMQERLQPMTQREIFSAAILYVCGDAALKGAVERVFAVLEKKQPQDREEAIRLAQVTLDEHLKRGPPGSLSFFFHIGPSRAELAEVLASGSDTESIHSAGVSALSLFRSVAQEKIERRLKAIPAGQVSADFYARMKEELVREAANPPFAECVNTARVRNVLAELLILQAGSLKNLRYSEIAGPRSAPAS